MKAPLHCYYEFAGEVTGNEIAFVAYGGGYRKTWNFLVRDNDRVFYPFSHLAQSAAQNDCCHWLSAVDSFLNASGCAVNYVQVFFLFHISLVISVLNYVLTNSSRLLPGFPLLLLPFCSS